MTSAGNRLTRSGPMAVGLLLAGCLLAPAAHATFIWSPPAEVSANDTLASFPSPDVGVASSGVGTVGWRYEAGDDDSFHVARVPATGSPGAPFDVFPAGSFGEMGLGEMGLDVAPDGYAVVGIGSSDFESSFVTLRSLSAAGTLGTAQNLVGPHSYGMQGPEIADDGTATAAWTAIDDGDPEEPDDDTAGFATRRMNPDGSLGAAQSLVTNGFGHEEPTDWPSVGSPRMDTAANGTSTTVWMPDTRSADETVSYTSLFARQQAPNGALGASITLLAEADNGSPSSRGSFDVASAPDGSAVVVWTRRVGEGGDGETWRLEARRISATGDLGATQLIDTAQADVDGGLESWVDPMPQPAVAMAADGTAAITWHRLTNPGGSQRTYDLRIRSMAAGTDALSLVQTVASALEDTSRLRSSPEPMESPRSPGPPTRIVASADIFARRIMSTGGLSEIEELMNAGTTSFPAFSLAAGPGGSVLIAMHGVDLGGGEVAEVARASSSAAMRTIRRRPRPSSRRSRRSARRSARRRLGSRRARPGSKFECALDSAALDECSSPVKTRNLSRKKHTFTVVATDKAGKRGRVARDLQVDGPEVASS